MPWSWPDPLRAREMPVEELAMCVLSRLVETDHRAQGSFPVRTGQILTWVSEWDRSGGGTRTQAEAALAHPELVEALAEAWEWLRANGFVAPAVAPGSLSPDAIIITRAGREILDFP